MVNANRYVEILGPFYSEEGLKTRGIEDTTGLIGVPIKGEQLIYPHGQFKIVPSDETPGTERLEKREETIEVWKLIADAVERGWTDAWTGAMILLGPEGTKPSPAEQMARDPDQVERVTKSVTRTIAAWRR